MNPDPDPAFQVNPDTDPDPVFWWPIIEEKKYSWNFFFFFRSKIAIYLPLGLDKGRPSYRRNLQPSQKIKFISCNLFFWALFALLDPDPQHWYRYQHRKRVELCHSSCGVKKSGRLDVIFTYFPYLPAVTSPLLFIWVISNCDNSLWQLCCFRYT